MNATRKTVTLPLWGGVANHRQHDGRLRALGRRLDPHPSKDMPMNTTQRAEIITTVSSLPFRRFHNALRILQSIDFGEMEEALGSANFDEAEWKAFRDKPFWWFIAADDADAAKVWQLIEARQPEELRS